MASARIQNILTFDGGYFNIDDVVKVTVHLYPNGKRTFVGRITNISNTDLVVTFDISTPYHGDTIRVRPIDIIDIERIDGDGDSID